jgi:ATP-dependent protease ClpP protease subunit
MENSMKDNNVFLTVQLNPETTNGVIRDMTTWLNNIPFVKKGNMFYKREALADIDNPDKAIFSSIAATDKIYTPYEEIPKHIPVLNVYINCSGGDALQLKSILSMFHMASARGVIIRTYNIGRASSSASMIAISGTHGYRIMDEYAFNLIHYGTSKSTIERENEVEFALKDLETYHAQTRDIYLSNTKLTNKELTKYYNFEGSGQLFAKECLQKGLCDWIATKDGRFINNIKELQSRQK